MRCLNSSNDIFRPLQKVQVHILQSTNQYEYALCFKSGDTDRIYKYTTKDTRGPVSSIIPTLISNNKILWTDESVIELIEELDDLDWCSSSYLFTVTNTVFIEYQLWLLDWIRKHKKYSIIETGNTIRTFLTHSIKYLGSRTKTPRSIMLPEVHTFHLRFSSKQRCSDTDLESMVKWYNDYIEQDETVLRLLLSNLNTQKTIYYREKTSGMNNYWVLENVQFEPYYAKIETSHTVYKEKTEAKQEQTTSTSTVQNPCLLNTPTVQNSNLLNTPVVQNSNLNVLNTTAIANPDLFPIVTPVNSIQGGNSGIIIIIVLVALLIIMVIVVALFLTSRSATIAKNSAMVATSTLPLTPIIVSS